jgi:LacI family transcriptional regulator
LERKPSTREAVVRELQNRIETGTLPTGARLPSERELSAELGVSRASIQNALKELESRGLIVRQENCRPIVMPLKTAARRSGIDPAGQIAVWMHPSLQELGAAMMMQGIRSYIGTHGYQLLVGCTPSLNREVVHRSEGEFLRSLVGNPLIAGAILWDTGNPAFGETYKELARAAIPVVFIDREPMAPIEADVVATNNRRAARTAVRYLIELGHSHIAMIVNDDPASSVTDRIDGYCAALQEAEIPYRGHYLLRLPVTAGQSVAAKYEPLLHQLLQGPESPTAVFAVNDQIALYVQASAARIGLSIPGDLSLVGFDWLMRWMPTGGDLTTIAQPFDEIGRVAAERLLERIEAGTQFIPRQILLDAPLIVRNTTAPLSGYAVPTQQ